jgi:hypothetical protein
VPATPEDATTTARTPEDAHPAHETRVDHVAALSLRADGTPDQTPGYVVITDDES